MSELIWKIKNLFRKVIPIALIAGLCYGGFVGYKKGLFGRKLTYQISGLTRSIPFFGSKFSLRNFHLTAPVRPATVAVARHSRRSRGHHSRKNRTHHGRRHRSHR